VAGAVNDRNGVRQQISERVERVNRAFGASGKFKISDLWRTAATARDKIARGVSPYLFDASLPQILEPIGPQSPLLLREWNRADSNPFRRW